MKSRRAIIWAIVFILGGAFLLAQNLMGFEVSAPVWSALLAALGVLFLLNFITELDQWWSLIPACILLGMSAVVYLAERDNVPGELIAGLILFSIGLPFLLIYAVQTARGHKDSWWALIPGGVLTLIAIFISLTLRANGVVIAALLMWFIALPFLVVYMANRQGNWWALIPGGVMLVIGVALASTLIIDLPNVFGGILCLGLGAVFGLLYWPNRGRPEMDWARYPSVILSAVGVGVIIFGPNWWPIVLIALGAAVLARAVWPRAAR